MSNTELAFYSTSAQILPVLLLAIGLQLRGFGLGTAPRPIKLQLPLQLPEESPEEYFHRIAPAVALADAWMGRTRATIALVCLSSVIVAEAIAVSVLAFGHDFTGARPVILVAGGLALALLAFNVGRTAYLDLTRRDGKSDRPNDVESSRT